MSAAAQSPQSGISDGRMLARKAYIVRLVQPIPQLEGFDQLVADYWAAVRTHLERQEIAVGPIRRIFAETVIGRGEDALLMLQQTNPGAHLLARSLVASGAVFEDLEDTETFQELLDWSQCANQQLMSAKVREIVQNGHGEASAARTEHMLKRLDDTIGSAEAALILTVSESLPIPGDIERYLVSPPELDRLERWLREKMEEARRQFAEEARAHEAAQAQQPPADEPPAGLWTPP